jgi:tRNA threonylcarbamoyladenosine biosynthesis protein TsaB
MSTVAAFDTSTESMAVALASAGARACWNGEGGAAASATLLPRLQSMLRAQGLTPRDLRAIAFGRGPGAFTGLRTACAVAQGLALGAGAVVLPIDSLLIVAEDAWVQCGRPLRFDAGVAMDARMGELYAARYRRHGDGWDVVALPALVDPRALAQAWGGWPGVVAGSGLGPCGLPQTVLALERCADRADALLRLALAAFARAEGRDAAQALPVYLRDKVALTTAERAARQAPAAAG